MAQKKKPFKIDTALKRIEEAIRPYPKAMLFELAERGYDSPFEQLVACLISIRTLDEVSQGAALRLLGVARAPRDIARLGSEKIARLIAPAAFAGAKATQIHAIAEAVAQQHGGELPCDRETLLSFKGVGPKCANLVLGIACGEARIGVDVHVHRVTQRWGYTASPTPEKTMLELEAKLPRKHWVAINRLLVPFGKHVCTGVRPFCSRCPVLEMCRQVGVASHR
jgi:endonuclease-3